MGSLEAGKILNSTNIFAPKVNRNGNSYAETLKTLNNFYVTKNMANSRAWSLFLIFFIYLKSNKF